MQGRSEPSFFPTKKNPAPAGEEIYVQARQGNNQEWVTMAGDELAGHVAVASLV